MDENNNVGDRQWLKFGILAGILLGTVLVIMLIRPLIFGRIVPAVMGGDGTTAVTEPIVEEIPVNTVAPAEDTTETEAVLEETAVPATQEPAAPAEPETGAEDTVTAITYTVQAGDSIYSIARAYNVSPAAIVAANDGLADPNNILVGSELLIPQP